MISAILWVIVYIVTGAAVICGAALGFGWLFVKALQHSPDCQCSKCQSRRMRKPHPWKAVEDEVVVPVPNRPRPEGKWWTDEKRNVPPAKGEWKSTLELRRGMFVIDRKPGVVYRVMSVKPDAQGFEITLRNQLSGEPSIVFVLGDKAQRRQWLVRTPRRHT